MYISQSIEIAYSEKHRKWHTMKHIEDMLEFCGIERPGHNEYLFYAILWHDFVYDPTRDDNEERSVEAWLKWNKDNDCLICDNCGDEDDFDINIVSEIIMSTKTPFADHDTKEKRLINQADFNIFTKSEKELLEYEDAIFFEYQHHPVEDYVIGRCDMLEWIKSNYEEGSVQYKSCDFLINHVRNKVYNVGIFAGSFNPYHIGHENIVQQAEKIFDKVIIAQGHNRDKEKPKKLEGMHREVVTYNGLLTDILDDTPKVRKTLVRGLRNSTDLENESALKSVINDQKEIKTTYFICDKIYEHISSSMIRSLYPLGKNTYAKYLPDFKVKCPSCNRESLDKDIYNSRVEEKYIECPYCNYKGTQKKWDEVTKELEVL